MENWKNKNILVVEDESVDYLLIKEILEESQVQIEHTKNGKKAIEQWANTHYDIIIMDINLPLMNGFEAVKEIRKFNNDVAIIALTTHYLDKQKYIELGFSEYIRKPLNQEGLLDLIRKYLNK